MHIQNRLLFRSLKNNPFQYFHILFYDQWPSKEKNLLLFPLNKVLWLAFCSCVQFVCAKLLLELFSQSVQRVHCHISLNFCCAIARYNTSCSSILTISHVLILTGSSLFILHSLQRCWRSDRWGEGTGQKGWGQLSLCFLHFLTLNTLLSCL